MDKQELKEFGLMLGSLLLGAGLLYVLLEIFI